MITKPKARKFRIRRSGPLSGATGAEARPDATGSGLRDAESEGAELLAPATEDGFGDQVFPTAAPRPPAAPAEASEATVDQEIDAIRREGLTGRQLRTARRVAQRHGIAATSDFDAVRRLRKSGIDPFQRANMLELVVSETQNSLPATRDAGQRMPQVARGPALPSTETVAEETRAREIMRIQQDLVHRRRRRSILLVARLCFFVLLPTFLAGYYYYVIATPFYSAKSAFVINKAENAAAGAIGGLFSGTQFANSQDSITVQAYLESRDAMERLNRDEGFKKVFSAPNIDPLQRLSPPYTDAAAYRIYQRNVKVGYDPSEGIIRLEVSTPDPQTSVRFSKALIKYSEHQVDDMTLRMRDDQMKGARASYQDAEKKLTAANKKVVELQTKYKVLSSDVEVSLLSAQIQALQGQLSSAQLDLQQIESAPNPTQARIGPLRERIKAIKSQIAAARAKMTVNDTGGHSLAQIQSQLLAAQADVQTRQLMLSQSLQALESARITANQQTRYLSIGVAPVAADEPTYPRAFEDTLVAFLIFSGLYLMLSMTASILREQASA